MSPSQASTIFPSAETLANLLQPLGFSGAALVAHTGTFLQICVIRD